MSSIEVEGIERTQVKIAFMKSPRVVVGSVKAAAIHIRHKIAPYPPKPPNSTYRRTNALLNNWYVQQLPLGAMVWNNRTYGTYVQGDYQTDMHAATRWKTTDEVSEEESEAVVKIIMDAINRVINS